MVEIDRPWVISYSTSIDPNILSVIIFELFGDILACNFDDFELGLFKVNQGQRS